MPVKPAELLFNVQIFVFLVSRPHSLLRILCIFKGIYSFILGNVPKAFVLFLNI